ncbi:MAG: TonB-dependent receptor [Bacteroidetes bacterium]|jgi:outer membrane cobalamin receptor|nr:TonB-dependent receptor [Bacteroidota bacterium]MBT4401323.1 TonB-dependent receptor [Bacteroidota bacterium]MBT4410933.1 TonB-dependent receptor [Bacteroidota bacterium]MBT7094035.1 TonB-dependent receptor [Bacteroidota bacterium]MBT7466267.1 TonB-dependent receptor [Bacteroidota bacterium]
MREFISILFLFLSISMSGQETSISGKITDGTSGQSMIAVNIGVDGKGGAISDSEGNYKVVTSPGYHKISFSFIGYETYFETVSVDAGKSILLNVEMQVSTRILDEIVVSAGRYEQKLSDVTVSMEVLKTKQLSNQNITSLDMILEKTSGINILDGQASIRGGSGFSYGAGSRILMLVDDMPMISGDAGDIKWSYLPVENINQVEVIKGASSVLYGSAALNGVIHLRNKFPGDKPTTEVTLFSGIYMEPKRKELVWWDSSPVFAGTTISHLRKIGNLDVMISGNYFQDNGYRELEYEKRGRGNLNLRYRFKKVPGLIAGISSSIMSVDASNFLLWQDADSGAYRQNPASYDPYLGLRYNIDPYAEYITAKGGKHSLKTRIYTIGNATLDKNKSSYARTVYTDYRYQKNFKNGIVWSSGTSVTKSKIEARLLDNHNSANYAIYSQLDARVGERFKLSGGVRWEMNMLDGLSYNALPVLRMGLNYRIGKATFIRSSLGQGYRFPSLAEKFASAEVGGLRIFPNHDLDPEKGWSAEIGVKQGLSLGRWRGYADLALFQTKYNNMIEYTFGMYAPDSILYPSYDYLGFKALNIGNARITGAELTFMGEVTYSPVVFRIISGYTFMHPIDIDKLTEEGLEPDDYILKYRYKHAFKADFEAETKRLLLGVNIKYSSRMVSVDDVFIDRFFGNFFLPGYPDYQKNNNSGYFLMDMRLAWKINEFIRFNLIARNLLNKEYIGRPGDIGAPRNITLQARVKF